MNDITNLDSQSVLVTGGTGSFGKRLITTLLERHSASRIVVYSRDKLKQSEIQQTEPFASHVDTLRYFIGDVRDAPRLHRALKGVDAVVHAAALKQVPAAEYNPFEAVKTNILGAQDVINASMATGVRRVMRVVDQ